MAKENSVATFHPSKHPGGDTVVGGGGGGVYPSLGSMQTRWRLS